MEIGTSSKKTKHFTPEFYIHSQECSESATQYESTDNAILKSEVTKEERKRRRRELNDIKKEEREKKYQAKLLKMSPDRRAIYEQKKAEKAERINKYNEMSSEDRKYFKELERESRLKRKNDRFLRKKERDDMKLAKMSPTRAKEYADKLNERRLKRDAVKNMTPDEKKIYDRERRKKHLEKTQKWNYVADNWSSDIVDVDMLIIDGNNIMGGGPRRHSRDEVIQHIAKVVSHCTALKNAEVICIFDHYYKPYDKVNGLNVQFSGKKTSDDVIVDELVKPCINTMVVTCDRGLAYRLLTKKCRVMRNMSFMKIVPGFESKYKRFKKDLD
jgi:hypothetical protein